MTLHAYNDAQSQAVFALFKRALEPAMAAAAPDWLLHHIELIRKEDFNTGDEKVEIRLVIKPIGSVRSASSQGQQQSVLQQRLGA
jgi:hypothetical protein